MTPQIAARAYELYGKRADNTGTAIQDWKKAEQEIRSDETKTSPTPEAEVHLEPKGKPEAPAPETKADQSQPKAKTVESKPEDKADEPMPNDSSDAPKPEAKAINPQPEERDEVPTAYVSPQLVKRVHELYEQLGREDVQAVQDWEKAKPEIEKHDSNK